MARRVILVNPDRVDKSLVVPDKRATASAIRDHTARSAGQGKMADTVHQNEGSGLRVPAFAGTTSGD
jgi:hypothetical protein